MSQFFCTISAAASSTVPSAPPKNLSLRCEKKSVYWLDPPSPDSGAHHEADGGTSYECRLGVESAREPFFIGGFQLMSNARQVDVFLITDDDRIPEENGGSQAGTFLTSVKGLSVASQDTPKLFKAQCVIPGGPRLVCSVRLVFQLLLSAELDGAGGSTNESSIPFRLSHVRWTLRKTTENLATTSSEVAANATPISASRALDPENNESSSAKTSFSALMNGSTKPQENSDLMVAVAGLAMALKGTEDRLRQNLHHETSIVRVQITDLSRQIEALLVAVQGMERKQEQNAAMILSRLQCVEERLDMVNLERQDSTASITPEAEANTVEDVDRLSP